MRLALRPTTLILLMLCVMYALTYIDRVNVSTAAIQFGPELGLSKTEIAIAFSAFSWTYLGMQVIGGWLGDRFGARLTLTVCASIWSLATVATGLVGGLTSMIVVRSILGLGEGATFPTATSAMCAWTPPERRGYAQGITHAASRMGNAAAPLIVAWLMVATNWRIAFYVLGAVSLLWVVIWFIIYRDHPADHPRISADELSRLPAMSSVRVARPPIPWLRLVRRMAPVTLTYFCYGWTLWLFLSWLPQYFLHSFNLNITSSAGFASAVFLAGVFGDLFGGWVTDYLLVRTGSLVVARRNQIVICMLCGLGCLLPMIWVHDVTVSTVCLAGGFFFAELTIGPMWAVPMDIAPKFAGTASGLMNTGSALAALVSPIVAGAVIDRTGDWDLIFIGSMILLVAGAISAFWMHPERPLDADEPPAGPRRLVLNTPPGTARQGL